MRRAILTALLVCASAGAQTPGDLAVFDSFTGAQSGAPVSDHTPERGARWRIEGSGPAPFTQAGRLLFPTGSSSIAVVDAPAGDRTLHTTVFQPAGHTASVVTQVYVRYVGPGDHVSLQILWPAASGNVGAQAPDALVTLHRTEGGAVTQSQLVATLPHTVYARDLPLVVQTAGAAVQVWIDGRLVGLATESAFAGASSIAVSAETPARPNGGTYAQIADVVVTTPAPLLVSVCPGLTGYDAQSCVRALFEPLRTYDYDEARDRLYTVVAATGVGAENRTVEGVYGGATAEWSPLSPLPPRTQVQDREFTAEHVWPRSRGAQTDASTDGAPHNDLHSLAPAFGPFNSARSNRPFGDAFDPDTQTAKWLRGRTTRYASSGPPSSPSTYSRVERDFTRQSDDGDGYASLAELGRFDVRHSRRGDVARQAAYFLALYRIEAEDGTEGRAFTEATLDVLLRWHRADPVDDAERTRDDGVFLAQGNRNPFTLDPTLLERTFYEGDAAPAAAGVWINEVHHTNAGTDIGEGVELAGPAGTDLYGYRVWAYSGSGGLYSVDGPGGSLPSVSFRDTIDDEGGGLGAVWAPAARLRGGCQGLALTDPAGRLVQFLSTGGCRFNALDGPVFHVAEAADATTPAHPDSLVWSTGIAGRRPAAGGTPRRVQEWSAMPAGYSLQLTGAGAAYAEFAWTGPLPATPGRLGDYQAPAQGTNRASGWRAGLPAPDGLLAPLADPGTDEDQPRPLTEATTSSNALSLGEPRPNPASHRVRFAVSAPPDATLSGEVLDALGRVVLRFDAPPVSLDVSRLAAGVYVVRVAARLSSGEAQHAARRFTVVR